jgi:hypothetical protein
MEYKVTFLGLQAAEVKCRYRYGLEACSRFDQGEREALANHWGETCGEIVVLWHERSRRNVT